MFQNKICHFSQMMKLSYQIAFAPEKYEKNEKLDKRDEIYICRVPNCTFTDLV